MSENKQRQTHTTGEVYVHPRDDGFRDNYCRIFGHQPFCGCNKKEEGDE